MLEKLEKYYEDGLLIKQTHPTKDLTIWNYSQKVQYEKLWDEITMQCRGLVTNSNGDIVGRPFKKFFNLEEMDSLPNGEFKIYEKLDGSLGILFNYENEWIFASRGSFTSEQSIKGLELLKNYNLEPLSKGYTYLFEIIYPSNRIVVDYGNDEKLILLGVVHTMIDDFEMPLNNCTFIEGTGFEVVKEYDLIDDIHLLKKTISNDNEGYVLKFNTRPISRIKIKGDEYVRLHRIITNISNRDIWTLLKDGKPLDELLEKVPDEFYDWVRQTEIKLITEFDKIKNDHLLFFEEIKGTVGLSDRRRFAESAFNYPHKGILFNMLDNKSYDKLIWNIIYPPYSKPFKNEQEN